MTRLAFATSLTLGLLLSPAAAPAIVRCVSPDDASCEATIQAAVSAATSGDEIEIRPKTDGTAYNEQVVVATSGLVIRGAGDRATFAKASRLAEFAAAKKPVDFRDPHVKRWLKLYPGAAAFKADMKAIQRFLNGKNVMARCPEVVVELCGTAETGPSACGVNADPETDVFVIQASGTTIRELTIRHGRNAIGLEADVADTTVESTCFRNNGGAVVSTLMVPEPNNHRTAVRRSFVDGASRIDGIAIHGDDAVVERNLLLNTEGIAVTGEDYRIAENAVSVTTDDECIEVDGGGEVRHNVLISCDGGIEVDEAVDAVIQGNFVMGVADDDEGIDASDVPESDTGPPHTGNLRTVLRHNVVRMISDEGVEFGGNEGVLEGNLIERAGNDSSEAGIRLAGRDNQVRFNLIRRGSQRGILLGTYFDAALGEAQPSSGNEIRSNLLVENHTSGIHIPAGFISNVVPIPVAIDTIVADNVIARQEGEGVSIPEGEVPANEPAAANTTLTGNVFEGNRTDLCNESASTVLGAGNVLATGGLDTDCVVETR